MAKDVLKTNEISRAQAEPVWEFEADLPVVPPFPGGAAPATIDDIASLLKQANRELIDDMRQIKQ